MCKKIYIKFCDVLRTKINFDDDILKWFPKFAPENVILGTTGSIVPFLIKLFPNERMHFEAINNPYRALADLSELNALKNCDISTFWSKVENFKNELGEPLFPDISRVIIGILSIPHSTANVERVFSYQNKIKSKKRNRLNVTTLASIIQTKDLMKSSNSCCYNLNISKELLTKNFT